MRKIWLAMLTISVLVISFQTINAKMIASLIGLWLFDEGKGDVAKDASENGNDGEITNSKWSEGKFGKALEFNGSNSCVTVPHSESLSISDDRISMTAWFTQDGSAGGAWHTIVCKGPMADVTENWAIFTNSSEQYICTTLTLEPAKERWWTTSGNGTVPIDGKWHHFATTYNGKELTYYVDGELVNSESKNGNLLPNDRDLTIGCRVNDGIQWGGLLDEIGIFNAVLAKQDIEKIMNQGYKVYSAVESVGKLTAVWGKLKHQF